MTATVDEIDDIALDLSSGHGSRAGIAALTGGLLELRAILVRTLLTVAADEAAIDAAAGLHEAYWRLAALQPDHPEVVSSMLCYPNTGPWLNHVLRRFAAESDDSRTPLWADCGYLGWLAASAGILAGTQGQARLVIRNGEVMLPGLGMAVLGADDHCGHCELHWTATGALHFRWDTGSLRIESPTEETRTGWLPLRTARVESDEITVWLDDLDPFRHRESAGSALPRLNAQQAQRWQRDFEQAWQLLRRDHDHYLTPMRGCLRSLSPLSAEAMVDSSSYTSANGAGCVYTTAATDSCQLALTLIHEVQHTKFGLLTDQVELFDPDPECRFYAPWRDDPRPILGLMHGIYAFFGVVDFWRVHRHSDCHGSLQAHADFELWRTQLVGAITQARASGLLTAAGTRFLDGLTAAMRSWSGEEVPATARQAAIESSLAHRVFWSVRNLTPDPVAIAELTACWDAERRAPTRILLADRVDQRTLPDHYRSLRLAAQLTTVDATAAAALADSRQPEGDRAYLAGYPSEAMALYSRELRVDPLRPQAWAGLALAVSKVHGHHAVRVLTDRAAVAARLYQSVGPEVEILDLLLWLSAGSDA
ncbi:HEXXH motif domain-containing protein [Nocardia sp. NPDC101769]|uniref:HEXXH motif domain-containing protein n=1 Tax=Nocardia sp. NPDC101769 TaxID=3364333 RepID=UPI00382A6672